MDDAIDAPPPWTTVAARVSDLTRLIAATAAAGALVVSVAAARLEPGSPLPRRRATAHPHRHRHRRPDARSTTTAVRRAHRAGGSRHPEPAPPATAPRRR